MGVSDKELFLLSKKILSIINISELMEELDKVFKSYLNISNWAIVIKPFNALYYYYDDSCFLMDNYNRNIFDWIEYDNMFYAFNEQDSSISTLIDQVAMKTGEDFPIVKKKITLLDEEYKNFKIEIYDSSDLDENKELLDIVFLAINNVIKYKKLLELTKEDSLTGLYNYKEFYKILGEEVESFKQNEKSFSIVFIDIDYFKKVNDLYGHLTGSNILIEFGNILLQDIRHKDCITRYGGDEYLILLRETNKQEAISVSKRLLHLIRHNAFLGEHGEKVYITASMGIATYPEDAKDMNQLIQIADDNMYKVKNETKDGVKW